MNIFSLFKRTQIEKARYLDLKFEDVPILRDVLPRGRYTVPISHPDRSGIFGGYRACVVHFLPQGEEDLQSQRLMIYALVGDYWDVLGQQPVTRMTVMHRAAELMQQGVPPSVLSRYMEMGVNLWKVKQQTNDNDY